MKAINSYLAEKLVIDKDSKLKEDSLLIKVLKDFTKSKLTPDFIEYVEKWVKKNNVEKYYFVTYKGKRAYKKLSPEIIDQVEVTLCTKDDEWDDILPPAWLGGHDPNYWVYEKLPGFIVCGNNECMLIQYDVAGDIKLLVNKDEDYA